MVLSEGLIHVAIRRHLKSHGWLLIAGQYPGGTDDELHTLNVYDPELAIDGSPDPRRHSLRKLVPDLVAHKKGVLLIVEAKPRYSPEDREKLVDLLNHRRNDFLHALEKFAVERNIPDILPVSTLQLTPALAFSYSDANYQVDGEFVYLRVKDVNSVIVTWPH